MTTKANKRSIYMVVVVLLAGVLACSVLQPTSQPPAQNVVPTSPPATNAPAPTEAPATSVPATPKPTATAEPAGIEQFPEFQALLNQMRDKGYIKSTEGSFVTVDDFSEEWAQINWYQYWTAQEEVGDFVFTGHFKWSTASATPEETLAAGWSSGCSRTAITTRSSFPNRGSCSCEPPRHMETSPMRSAKPRAAAG